MHCLECGYDLRDLPERRCPECGRAFDPEDKKSWGNARTFRAIGAVRWLGRLTFAIALVITGCTIWRIALGYKVPMTMVIAFFGGGSLLFAPLLLWRSYVAKYPQARSRILEAGLAICMMIMISIGASRWPLLVSLKISEPALKRFIQDAQAGNGGWTPLRAGLFTISDSEKINGSWVLWIDKSDRAFVYNMTDQQITQQFNSRSWDRINAHWHIVNQ